MFKDLTALEELLSIVENETGVNDNCADEPDGEPVGWREDGPLPMTFGHARRARAELDAWKSKTNPGGTMTQPIQPLIEDDHGVIRFKANAIVQHLLDHGEIDLNQIAALDFSREDREQFAQLIGYSWSGACDLSYMTDEVLDAAEAMRKSGASEDECRAATLRAQIEQAKESMREGVAQLFGVHPDDLSN